MPPLNHCREELHKNLVIMCVRMTPLQIKTNVGRTSVHMPACSYLLSFSICFLQGHLHLLAFKLHGLHVTTSGINNTLSVTWYHGQQQCEMESLKTWHCRCCPHSCIMHDRRLHTHEIQAHKSVCAILCDDMPGVEQTRPSRRSRRTHCCVTLGKGAITFLCASSCWR